MKIRIVKRPVGWLEGLSLARYRVGECYDVPTTVGEYLILLGFAHVEMREKNRPRPTQPERRRRH